VANEHSLSPKAWVRIVSHNKAWRINDRLVHDGKTFNVQYAIDEALTEEAVSSGTRWRATLSGAATIVDAYSARTRFPMQLAPLSRAYSRGGPLCCQPPSHHRGYPTDGVATLSGIADALNSRGIRSARGGRWHVSSVQNLLARAESNSASLL
jgi:hypothetical protein